MRDLRRLLCRVEGTGRGQRLKISIFYVCVLCSLPPLAERTGEFVMKTTVYHPRTRASLQTGLVVTSRLSRQSKIRGLIQNFNHVRVVRHATKKIPSIRNVHNNSLNTIYRQNMPIKIISTKRHPVLMRRTTSKVKRKKINRPVRSRNARHRLALVKFTSDLDASRLN